MTPREIKRALTVACPVCGQKAAQYCVDFALTTARSGKRSSKVIPLHTGAEPHGARLALAASKERRP